MWVLGPFPKGRERSQALRRMRPADARPTGRLSGLHARAIPALAGRPIGSAAAGRPPLTVCRDPEVA
jgi:hypothetical protein